MIKLLTISGSPVPGSSTEILLKRAAQAFVEAVGPERQARDYFVSLNDLDFIPCQACGEAPTPKWCFFDDDLVDVFRRLADCDCLLIGSPIYFDAVSAQLKAFMDRCNCFRPGDFNNIDPRHDFIRLLPRKRPGGIVLVGGEKGWFEGARRSIAGFFRWVEVVTEAKMTFHSRDFNRVGEAAGDTKALEEAEKMGRQLALAAVAENAR